MARVEVKHGGMTNPDAKKIPPRTPIPSGVYNALIVGVQNGLTKQTPALQKVTVEFQILYSSEKKEETFKNRRVFQDYVLESGSNEETNQLRRAQLVQLLDATKTPYDDNGFDDDDLKNKPCRITIRSKKGNEVDPISNQPIMFANVVMVDTAEEVDQSALV
jgi:hypothetical protein